MNIDEQMKLAESGHTPMLDDDGSVIGWSSPIRYFNEEDLYTAFGHAIGMKTFVIFCCNSHCADRQFQRLADIVRNISTVHIQSRRISDINTEVLFVVNSSGSVTDIERVSRGKNIVGHIPCGRLLYEID